MAGGGAYSQTLGTMLRLHPLTTPLTTSLLLFAIAAFLLPIAALFPPGTLTPRLGEESLLLNLTGFRWSLLWQIALAPWVAHSLPEFLVILAGLLFLRTSEFPLGPMRLFACLWLAQASILLLAQMPEWQRASDDWIWSPIWPLCAAVSSSDLCRQDRREILRRSRIYGFYFIPIVGFLFLLLEVRQALFIGAGLLIAFSIGFVVSRTMASNRFSRPQLRELKRRIIRDALRQRRAEGR